MTAQEWMDRYVAQVGRLLPAKGRADLEMEIRSLLQDELDARLQGQPADEATALAVLQQFGSPNQMAAKYGAQQYLIGPRLFPTFVTVLGIVLAVSIGLYCFGVIIDASVNGGQPDLAAILGGFFETVLQTAGVLVLVFALIERAAGYELARHTEQWDARSLPPADDQNRVKWGDAIANVVLGLVAIVVFNFYIDESGRFVVAGSGWSSVPFFSQEFLRFIPWLTTIWAADGLLSLLVLARGSWRISTRLAAIVIKAAGIVLMLALINGGPLTVYPQAEIGVTVALAIGVAASIVEILKSAWHIVAPGRSAGGTMAPMTR